MRDEKKQDRKVDAERVAKDMKRINREIDRVRVIACLTTIPNLIHSDSRTDTLSSSDCRELKSMLKRLMMTP